MGIQEYFRLVLCFFKGQTGGRSFNLGVGSKDTFGTSCSVLCREVVLFQRYKSTFGLSFVGSSFGVSFI